VTGRGKDVNRRASGAMSGSPSRAGSFINGSRQQALLFVNKKNPTAGAAKNFFNLDPGRLSRTAADQQSFLRRFFSKKAAAFFDLISLGL
jgi:hypothetical protein